MSNLPRIPSHTPTTVPAQAEQSFPDWFVRSLAINAEPAGAMRCAVVLQPYDYASGEAGPAENAVRFEFDDLRTTAGQRAAGNKPALMQALGLVLQAVSEIAAEEDTSQPVIEFKAEQ